MGQFLSNFKSCIVGDVGRLMKPVAARCKMMSRKMSYGRRLLQARKNEINIKRISLIALCEAFKSCAANQKRKHDLQGRLNAV